MFPRVCSSIKYLSCNWSKCITWSNISQLKMGNIRWYSQIFKFSFTTIKVFVQNLIQDERVVCFCHRRKDVFVCSWIRTINSKRTSEHPTLAWRLINTASSILQENIYLYLSLNIICFIKHTVFCSSFALGSEQLMAADKIPNIPLDQKEAQLDHRWRQNVVRTKKRHTRRSRMSLMIYYCTDPRQLWINLFIWLKRKMLLMVTSPLRLSSNRP